MIGALSLARLAIDGLRAWWNGRRTHEEIIEDKQDERQERQADDPRERNEEDGRARLDESRQEEDQDKVNMQWQIGARGRCSRTG